MCEKETVTLRDLILGAVCELQEKNGVQACEIAQFVARKRGCKLSQIEEMINIILCKAKNCGILCENRGCYRIEEKYDDLPGKTRGGKDKQQGNGLSLSEDSDDDEDDEDKGPDPCLCLKLSKDCLDDDEEENRCPGLKKKRKCG